MWDWDRYNVSLSWRNMTLLAVFPQGQPRFCRDRKEKKDYGQISNETMHCWTSKRALGCRMMDNLDSPETERERKTMASSLMRPSTVGQVRVHLAAECWRYLPSWTKLYPLFQQVNFTCMCSVCPSILAPSQCWDLLSSLPRWQLDLQCNLVIICYTYTGFVNDVLWVEGGMEEVVAGIHPRWRWLQWR